MISALTLSLLAGGSALTSCNVLMPSKTQTASASASSSSSSSSSSATQSTVTRELIGDWIVIDLNGNQVTSAENDVPHLGFATNQENSSLIDFYAYNGCNFLNGVVALNGGKITKQGDFASTMRLCPDAKYEMGMTTALEQMKSLKIQRINNESFLYLLDGSGRTVMTLRKHNLNFLEGAWRVTSIDGNKLPQDVEIEFVVDLQANTLHGNAGCNVVNGTVDINMDVENGIGFSNLRTTRMTCPNIAYESSFLQAMERVATATGDGNKARFRNSAGETIMELTRLSKTDLEK
nr:META domain-containing protein [Bacteroides sp.]